MSFATEVLELMLDNDRFPVKENVLCTIVENTLKRLARRKALDAADLQGLVTSASRQHKASNAITARALQVIGRALQQQAAKTAALTIRYSKYISNLTVLYTREGLDAMSDLTTLLRVAKLASHEGTQWLAESLHEAAQGKRYELLKWLLINVSNYKLDLGVRKAAPRAVPEFHAMLFEILPSTDAIDFLDTLLRLGLEMRIPGPMRASEDANAINANLLRLSIGINASTDLDTALKHISRCREKAQTSRDATVRAFWVEAAFRFAGLSCSLDTLNDTLLWARRYNSDSLTIKTAYGSDVMADKHMVECLAGMQYRAEWIVVRTDLKQRLKQANRTLLFILETAVMFQKVPGFQAHAWQRSLRSMLRNVIESRMRKTNFLVSRSSWTNDVVFQCVWQDTLETLLKAEQICLAEENVVLSMRDLDGLTYPIEIQNDWVELPPPVLPRIPDTDGENVSEWDPLREPQQPDSASLYDIGKKVAWVVSEEKVPAYQAGSFWDVYKDSHLPSAAAKDTASQPRASLVKITTVKMLAELLHHVAFDESFSVYILRSILVRSTHLDTRAAVVSSLVQILSKTTQERTREAILAILEQYAVPMAASMNERKPMAEQDWLEAETALCLPEVSVEHPLQASMRTTAIILSPTTLQAVFHRRIIVPLTQASAENNARWTRLFLEKYDTLHLLEIITPVPTDLMLPVEILHQANPVTAAITELVTPPAFEQYSNYVMAVLGSPQDLLDFNRQLREISYRRRRRSTKPLAVSMGWRILPMLEYMLQRVDVTRTTEWQQDSQREPSILPSTSHIRMRLLPHPGDGVEGSRAEQVERAHSFADAITELLGSLAEERTYHVDFNLLKEHLKNKINQRTTLDVMKRLGSLGGGPDELLSTAQLLQIELAQHLLSSAQKPEVELEVKAVREMLDSWVASADEEVRKHSIAALRQLERDWKLVSL
ncbi:hypothetical protein B0A48_06442 [Cryoendolithus antarcticus]|uniref:Uncharacterized protein n=1 Tax=Cryoendolithus antarcticus TaxID=1507870 RepID=A0A1V8TBK8_9PEZI|nr:hypothetical protein B0A48_06442 [Cryoendolithus antarcticus]